MKQRILGLIISLCSSMLFASITTSIEPSTPRVGEPFRLNITLVDETADGTPDLIALQNEFTLDGTEHRVSYTLINGNAQNISQWTLLLTPKRAGHLTIPSIQIGQIQTQAKSILVEGETKKSSAYLHTLSDDPLQINTKVDEKKPYINQQIRYSVKLYNRAPLLNAAYEPPHLDEALMIPLGNRSYQTLRKGQRYEVEEQHYAFFPQKSGEQTIDPPVFKALLYGATPRQIRVKGTPTQLLVQSMPANYTGRHWLPAKSITLTEHFEDAKTTPNVGDTLTRIITLRGIALPAELLTLPSTKSTPNYSIYAEKAHLRNTIHGEDVMGTTTVKLTYLFNTQGSITLPGFSITWFNTQTQKEEKAELPSRTLQIAAQKKPLKKEIKPARQAKAHPTNYLALTWIGMFILGLTLCSGFFYFRKNKKASPLHELKLACKKNQPFQAEQALLAWAKSQ
ncbi:MAG: BatD family protein, partial [Legionellaceae bacterium]